MTETRAQLFNRKLDLFAAIRQLEQDLRDGLVDREAYTDARRRYELEAAEILKRLDTLPEAEVPRPAQRPWLPWAIGAAALVAALSIVLFLVAGTHARNLATQSSAAPTAGSSRPNGSTQSSPQLHAARQAALAHPRSPTAQMALGNAYLQAGDAQSADAAYRRAMRLAPGSPEPATLHAMVLGAEGQSAAGLVQLHRVEARHPAYAKAWFLDGLLASHVSGGRARALASWKRFLALQPNGSVATTVRQWVAGLETGAKAGKP